MKIQQEEEEVGKNCQERVVTKRSITRSKIPLRCLFRHHGTAINMSHLTKFKLLLSISLMFTVCFFLHCFSLDVVKNATCCCGQRTIAADYYQILLARNTSTHDEYDADDDDDDEDNSGYQKDGKPIRRRLPQALIIGTRKCGTRALLEFLSAHHEIRTQKREMHFFDVDDNYNLGFEWYRKRMPYSRPHQITVEKTPAYFTEPEVPERLWRMNNSVKLIVVVRNPIARTISDYAQINANKVSRGKFYSAFDEIVFDRRTGAVDETYKGIWRSLYHRHLLCWLKWFRMGQFHFVNGENLVVRPLEELRRVEEFLGLEHNLTERNFYYNETRGFYCLQVTNRTKCLSQSKGRKHPTVKARTLAKLKQFFLPHNKRFYDLVGINFGWT